MFNIRNVLTITSAKCHVSLLNKSINKYTCKLLSYLGPMRFLMSALTLCLILRCRSASTLSPLFKDLLANLLKCVFFL